MKNNRFSILSVLTVLCTLPCVTDAAVRIGAQNSDKSTDRLNRAGIYYNNAQAQTQQAQQQIIEETASFTTADLPLPVANEALAQRIIDGDPSAPTLEMLEKCALLIPGGEFEWATPTIGLSAGKGPTCVAVVELRDLNKVDTAANKQYTVLARAKLAVGESINCNASDFPDSAYMPNLGEIVVPADAPPTVEDVVAVMNEEQKQNAGLKILSAAVIGGLGGNFLGKNEPGKDSMLGGGKDKIKSTLIGAAGSAALATASTYSGKVAGDMIMSAGVNAAAGAVVGNMAANGKSVLRIERCTVDGVEQNCLWGVYVEQGTLPEDISKDTEYFVKKQTGSNFIVCGKKDDAQQNKTCKTVKLDTLLTTIKGYEGQTNATTGKPMTFDDIIRDKFEKADSGAKYCYDGNKMTKFADEICTDDKLYIKIEGSPTIVSKTVPAMLVGVEDKAFGYKESDWDKIKSNYSNNKIVGRTGNGQASNLSLPKDKETPDFEKFKPVTMDADDGGIIDMSNKARTGGTLTGAGVGAGMGAFTAYQGAQTEIDERWAAAVQEYKDSLQKFFCGSGNKFMSFYNDVTAVPALQ